MQLDSLQRQLANLERQACAHDAEIASAQYAWEASLRDRGAAIDWASDDHLVARHGFDQTIAPRRTQSAPEPQFREGQPRYSAGAVGSAINLDGRGFIDLGDLAGFGFFEKFTLAAWIKPSGSHGGTVISRMAEDPQEDGYRVVLAKGKIQVNLVKPLARRRDPGRDQSRRSLRINGRMSR